MASTRGTVSSLDLGRAVGKVYVHSKAVVAGYPIESDHVFLLYRDGSAPISIDPTELVKRNWLIGLLQRALADRLEVSISHSTDEAAEVRSVILYAPHEPAG